MLVISRSGTTTEVVELLDELTVRTVLITAVADSPAARAAAETIVIDFADERSVVQTRSATSAVALLRGHLGDDLAPVATAAERAVRDELPQPLLDAEQYTFVASGWGYGLALEAALKLREAAGAWAEAYPAMEYRHGPITVAAPGRVVWSLDALPTGLAEEVTATGAHLEVGRVDPLVELVRAQRVAVHVAKARGLDPDSPRHLNRSVILA
ncbi:MAG TPA: sugar isomerase [Kineosporiaceae bacterium]|nr:sugar isomerase [Kineosporiaceae bacterium]